MTRAARARAIDSQQRLAVISTSSISSGRHARGAAACTAIIATRRPSRSVDATIDEAIPTAVNAVRRAELADDVVEDQRVAAAQLADGALAERRQGPRADERCGDGAARVLVRDGERDRRPLRRRRRRSDRRRAASPSSRQAATMIAAGSSEVAQGVVERDQERIADLDPPPVGHVDEGADRAARPSVLVQQRRRVFEQPRRCGRRRGRCRARGR